MSTEKEIFEYYFRNGAHITRIDKDIVIYNCRKRHRHIVWTNKIDIHRKFVCSLCEHNGIHAAIEEIVDYYRRNNVRISGVGENITGRRCSNGHYRRLSVSSIDITDDFICTSCVDGKRKIRYDHEFLSFVEEEGYHILDPPDVINSGVMLNFVCPKGHKLSITASSFRQGKRCVTCFFREIKDNKRSVAYGRTYNVIYRTGTDRCGNNVFICENGHMFCTTSRCIYDGVSCFLCQPRQQNCMKK